MRGLAALLVLGLASAAHADAVVEPFAGITLEELYDSNVLNSRGSDAVTRVTPRVGLLLETHRLQLGAEYRLALHGYAMGSTDSTVNHRGAMRLLYRATPRLDLKTDAVVVAGDDPVLLDRPGVAIPQGGFFDLVADAGLAYRLTRRTDLALNYMFRRSTFDLAVGPAPVAFDGDEHRVDAVGGWRATRRLTGRVLLRGQHFESDGAMSGTLGEAVGGGIGGEYAITERTRARAYGGPLYFTGSTGGVGWFGGADVTRIGRRWRLALRFLHDVYGGTSAADAVWFDSLQLDTSIVLHKNLDLRVRAGGYRGGVAPDHETSVSGLIARSELGWNLLRNARLELYGEHRAQDAGGGIAFGDVQRTVAGLRFIAVLGTDLQSTQGELP